MTANRQFRDEVRRFAAAHGLSFADARRRVLVAREAEAASGSAGRGAPGADAVRTGVAARSSVEEVLAVSKENTVMANNLVRQNLAVTAAVQMARDSAKFQVTGAAKMAEQAFQDGLRQRAEWTKSFTQGAAGAATTSLLDQVSKHHDEIVNAARRSVVGGSAAEEAKKAFLVSIRKQEGAAAGLVQSIKNSIDVKAAQDVLDSVTSLEKGAVKSMASVWNLGQPVANQPWLQHQVLFQPPIAEAAAPAWTLPAQSVKMPSADRDAEIRAALADVQERQERIEKLLQQVLEKDENQK